MSRRKRKYISYPERLAAALVELLSVEQQVDLRARQAPARAIIRLFTNDHIVLHALGGKDKWWNLHARLRGPDVLKKNASDTTIVAKVKRVAAVHNDFVRRVTGPVKVRRRNKSRWPSRPFPKRIENALDR